MARIWMLLATLMLAACDNPDDASQAPAVQANDEQISEAVEEASRHSGEQADESADCGPLEWLLDRLPEQVEGLSQTYRGCESPVTALVLFEDGKRSRMASITVLDPALAGLDDSGSGQWAQLLSDTRKGVLRAIAEQVPFTQVQDDEPQPTQPVQIVLEDGTGAILFSVDGVWDSTRR